MKREQWIDSLKGIAILFVMAIHCGSAGLPTKIARIVSSGGAWVQMFLLLSVILSLSSLSRLYAEPRVTMRMVLRWLLSRFVRLAPLYFLAILFAIFVTGGAIDYLGSEGYPTLTNIVCHGLFLHGLFPHYANSILAVEWYIGVLSLFYIFAPVLYRAISNPMRAFVAFVISIPLCHFCTVGAYSFILPHVADRYVWSCWFSVFWPIASLPTILLGVLVFHIRKMETNCSAYWKKAGAFSAFMLFGLLYHGLIKGETSIYYVKPQLLFALAFTVLILAYPFLELYVLNNKVLHFFGKHSYGLYLFHMMFYIMMDRKGISLNWYLRFLSCISCTLVVALLTERFVDKPCQKFWKRISEDGHV